MNAAVGIIGVGWVGASVAISALHAGVANELLLSDVRGDVAEDDAERAAVEQSAGVLRKASASVVSMD